MGYSFVAYSQPNYLVSHFTTIPSVIIYRSKMDASAFYDYAAFLSPLSTDIAVATILPASPTLAGSNIVFPALASSPNAEIYCSATLTPQVTLTLSNSETTEVLMAARSCSSLLLGNLCGRAAYTNCMPRIEKHPTSAITPYFPRRPSGADFIQL